MHGIWFSWRNFFFKGAGSFNISRNTCSKDSKVLMDWIFKCAYIKTFVVSIKNFYILLLSFDENQINHFLSLLKRHWNNVFQYSGSKWNTNQILYLQKQYLLEVSSYSSSSEHTYKNLNIIIPAIITTSHGDLIHKEIQFFVFLKYSFTWSKIFVYMLLISYRFEAKSCFRFCQ